MYYLLHLVVGEKVKQTVQIGFFQNHPIAISYYNFVCIRIYNIILTFEFWKGQAIFRDIWLSFSVFRPHTTYHEFK